jgi:DAK2 domain fusion protein YloV
MNSESSLRTPVLRLNGAQFKHLLAGGVAMLEKNYQYVNTLNVFPVPDGDTGTNMLMTVRNAWKFIADIDDADFGKIATQFARGAIRGSRGNSGTILSELLRGFAGEVSGLNDAGRDVLTVALRAGVRTAYSVIEKPVEGTILTVAREVAEEAEGMPPEVQDLVDLLGRIVHRAQISVAQTPELLPILRKAGVVDSGAQGLAYFLEGMYRHAMGDVIAFTADASPEQAVTNLSEVLQPEDPQGYGYDVQFLVQGRNLDVAAIRAAINHMGESGVITGDDSVVKVHIHVHDPGIPLSYGVSLGAITDIVVENMALQAEGYIAGRSGADLAVAESALDPTALPVPEPVVAVEPGKIAVISAAPGEGFRRILQSMGVAHVISGGQTMNPSSGEFVEAIQRLPTDKIIVLPNNKNIVLTAQQAAKEVPGKDIRVITTRTMPQGIAALLAFDPDMALDAVGEAMQSAVAGVLTGEITTASRSVDLEGVNVQEGQIIGLLDGKLVVTAPDSLTALHDLLRRAIVDSVHELVTIYHGADIAPGAATKAVDQLRIAFPNQEFDLAWGGQPYYPYILSVE